MQIKKVIYGDEARNKLYKGFKTVADAVATTAGPGGRNVALQQSYGAPKISKDGVSVAKAITLLNEEGEGAKMIIQASEKQISKLVMEQLIHVLLLMLLFQRV